MTPAVDIRRMTVLEPEDLLTTIRIPNTWAGANFYFEKVADRGAWDFPLVNVAAALRLEGGPESPTPASSWVPYECIPRRLTDVEDLVRGRVQNEETAAPWRARPQSRERSPCGTTTSRCRSWRTS